MKNSTIIRKLLVVDDDEIDRFCLKQVAEKINKEVIFFDEIFDASNGEEALEIVSNRFSEAELRSALILLDLKMPKMDGLEFLKSIRNDPKIKDIVVVVLSSSDHEKDIKDAYNYHVSGYIKKPLQQKALSDLIYNFGKYWSQSQKPKG